MTEFTIDKNVPMPKPRRPASKYPFKELDVGDSVLFSGSDHSGRFFLGALYRAQRETGRKFTTRKTPEGFRVWRIE